MGVCPQLRDLPEDPCLDLCREGLPFIHACPGASESVGTELEAGPREVGGVGASLGFSQPVGWEGVSEPCWLGDL